MVGPTVALDKSYLDGRKLGQIWELCLSNEVLMSEHLFFELITTDRQKMARAFRKLPPGWNAFHPLEHVGRLLRYEKENCASANAAVASRMQDKYRLNRALALGTFEPTDAQRLGIHEWQSHVGQLGMAIRDRTGEATRIFPALDGYRPGQPRTVIEEVRQEVAHDVSSIRAFYASIKPPGFPHEDLIDDSWAIFRWVQVQLLIAIRYFAKWGLNAAIEAPKHHQLEHDVSDAQYLITGALVGGLATCETWLKDDFRLLCPGGTLLC